MSGFEKYSDQDLDVYFAKCDPDKDGLINQDELAQLIK